jgi:uncharacterized protein HemX
MNGKNKVVALLCIALFGAGFAIGFFVDTRGASSGSEQLAVSQERTRKLRENIKNQTKLIKQLRNITTKEWKNYKQLKSRYTTLREEHQTQTKLYQSLRDQLEGEWENVSRATELINKSLEILQQDTKK